MHPAAVVARRNVHFLVGVSCSIIRLCGVMYIPESVARSTLCHRSGCVGGKSPSWQPMEAPIKGRAVFFLVILPPHFPFNQ